MILSPRTLQIVKNFSTINRSILFQKGSTLRTISKTPVLAEAKIDEDLPSDFGIFDLPKFLSVLSMMEAPDIEIGEKFAVIRSGNKETVFMFASPGLFDTPGERKIQNIEFEVSFPFSTANLSALQKALGVLQLPHIAIEGAGGKIFVHGIDADNPSADVFTIDANFPTKHNFYLVFTAESFRLMQGDGDYIFEMSSRQIGYFHNDTLRVKYWIPCNKKNSKFEV